MTNILKKDQVKCKSDPNFLYLIIEKTQIRGEK